MTFRPAYLLCICLFNTMAIADANQGEFLGYQVGSRVTIEDPSLLKLGPQDATYDFIESLTRIRKRHGLGLPDDLINSFYLNVESVNDEFSQVTLTITPVTYTVVEIRGLIQFGPAPRNPDSWHEAGKTRDRFWNVLGAKYSDWDVDECNNDGFPNEKKSTRVCTISGQDYRFELRIGPYDVIESPTLPKNHRPAYIEIKLRSKNDDLYDLELEETQIFAERRVAEEAEKTDKTGL